MGLADLLSVFFAVSSLKFPPKARSVVDDCREIVVSETLAVLIEPWHLLEHLLVLQDIADSSHGNRQAGSRGHNRTIDYIQDFLKSQGYYVEVQPFHDTVPVGGDSVLVVNDVIIDAEPIGWSPNCNLTSLPILHVDGFGCRAVDYPQAALGSIVLVAGGGCSLSDKSISAGIAGANGLLLHESAQLTPNLGGSNDYHIPSARISDQDAWRLINSNHPPRASLFEITGRYERISSYNVFAT